MSNEQKQMVLETLERQRAYVEEQAKAGTVDSVVYADAFLRGIRDLGYKSPAWALAELIDNSFQSGAERIEIVLGFQEENTSEAKPDHVAVVDDGVGMIPAMISQAVRWGGTDREEDRSGFGRFGYGLPSAAVSLAKSYHVYSRTADTDWHRVSVDIVELGKAAAVPGETAKLLEAVPTDPPEWVFARATGIGEAPASGTVVVLDEIDRLRDTSGWITRKSLKAKLLTDLGTIYRHWLTDYRVWVDGTELEAMDPLFLMPDARLFAENSVRAQRVSTKPIEVEAPSGGKGQVRVRAAVLPPNFQRRDPDDASGPKNARHKVMKAYNGLLVCRHGRQIDCIQPWWTKFQNYDMNVKVELDFDAALDELFSMTTSKQQVVVKELLEDKLRPALEALIKDMRGRLKELRSEDAVATELQTDEDGERPSEEAMEAAEPFRTTPEVTRHDALQEGQEELQRRAKQISKVSGETEQEVVDRLIEQVEKQRYRVEFAAEPEGPFYRPNRLGTQKRVIINTAHPFYTRVFDRAPSARYALEVLLLVMAASELESSGDMRKFYEASRIRWSERLKYALQALESDESLADHVSAVAESLDMES